MLAMTSVIVDDYMFKTVFLTFYTLQARPPKRRLARGNLLLCFASRRDWVH